jgi:hypothetical protein
MRAPKGPKEFVSFALSGLRIFRLVPRAYALGYILAAAPRLRLWISGLPNIIHPSALHPGYGSREAARESSPRRKPWVEGQGNASPEGRKSSFLSPFQGCAFADWYPGLTPWATFWPPLRGFGWGLSGGDCKFCLESGGRIFSYPDVKCSWLYAPCLGLRTPEAQFVWAQREGESLSLAWC